MEDNEPAISLADFTTLQQELLRLKYENYDLQTQLQKSAQGGAKASGAGHDRSTWSYVPKIPNNLANMVSSAAMKIDGQIRTSIDVANANVARVENAEEVLRLEQQLRSLEQAHAALIIESDAKLAQMQTELARGATHTPRSTSAPPVSNGESEETSVHYLAKIQSQQSELDKLRDVVDKQQEELKKIVRQELDQDSNSKPQRETNKFSLLKRSDDRRTDETEQMKIEKRRTSTLKDEKAALENHQQALETRLNEALTESKQAFAMKCMIQSMGKKIKDYEQLLSQQKERSTRALQEANSRWERERLPMATEDLRSMFTTAAAAGGRGYGKAVGSSCVPREEAGKSDGTVERIHERDGNEGGEVLVTIGIVDANANADNADIGSNNLPSNEANEQKTGEHREMDVEDVMQQMEGLQKELDEYRAESEKLRVQVNDLEVEKGIIERRTEERVSDLKTLLRKRVEQDKKRTISTPPMFPQTTQILDRFVVPSDEETEEMGTPTYSSPSPTQGSSKPPKETAIGDALYLLKISELEALCEGLKKDLEICQQSETVLKEDIRHKRLLITHMLKKMATTATPNDVEDLFGNKAAPSGNNGGVFAAGIMPTASFFPTLFSTSQTQDTIELENALEGSMADNMRLRDNIRVLGDQLRYYLTKEAEQASR